MTYIREITETRDYVRWPELAPFFIRHYEDQIKAAMKNEEVTFIKFKGAQFRVAPVFPANADGHGGKYGFRIWGPAHLAE